MKPDLFTSKVLYSEEMTSFCGFETTDLQSYLKTTEKLNQMNKKLIKTLRILEKYKFITPS